MNFETWVQAKGFDPLTLTEPQRAALQAAYQREQTPPPVAQPVTPPPLPQNAAGYDATRQAIDAETERIEAIRSATTRTAENNIGNSEKLKQLWQLCDAAVADKTCTTQKFELDLFRLDRSAGPVIVNPSGPKMSDEVLEASVARTIGIGNLVKHYGEQTLDASHRMFPNGIGLKELIRVAAQQNNRWRGSSNDMNAMCRAAFRIPEDHGDGRMAVGPSVINVPTLLSNVGNKALEQSFLNTEQAWRQVGKIRSLNDFKTQTQIRISGDTTFKKVPPGGKIEHGTLSELTYSLKLDSYGILIGIDFQQMRNDDLGALSDMSKQFGRGAGIAINKAFWTDTWIPAQATYFPTDDSKDNYVTGASSVLGLAGLDLMEAKFRRQTQEDGLTPLGEMPKVLLVPATLANSAAALMGTQQLVVGTTPASGVNLNVFAGRYTVASSAYLDGTSDKEFWLLADPDSVPVIQIGFLDGVDRPKIETADFDFSQLGLAMRGTMHFGVAMAEYRGGVKSKAAA